MKMIIITVSFALFASDIATAQTPPMPDNQFIICLLPLDHVNAQELAGVLAPFQSPAGTIEPYPPTNTLIIKDKASVVRSLIKVMKGKEDLGECQNLRCVD
jgi:type II secretory pathway component GspD/PulD (secretin)